MNQEDVERFIGQVILSIAKLHNRLMYDKAMDEARSDPPMFRYTMTMFLQNALLTSVENAETTKPETPPECPKARQKPSIPDDPGVQ